MNGNSKVFLLPFLVVAVGSVWALAAPTYIQYFFPVVLFGLSGLLVVGIRSTILKGELPGRFGSITYRDRSPVAFWIGILIFAVMALFFFFLGLAMLGLAPRWFIALLRSMHS